MCQSIKNKKRYGDRQYGRISLYKINKVLDSDTTTDLEGLVPEEYHDSQLLLWEANTN